MTDIDRAETDARLDELKPILGQRIISLIEDDTNGSFGFETENGTEVWIQMDPENNGPGFANVVLP